MSTFPTRYGNGFMCDACGEEWSPPETPGTSPLQFAECLALAQRAGWKSVQVKSRRVRGGGFDWEHRCPGCV